MTIASVDFLALRKEFNRKRKLRLDMAKDKALWIVDVTEQCGGEPTVLVACEGGGIIRFTFDRPLNLYRLFSAGFPGGIAQHVLELLVGLFPPRTS